MKSKKKLEISPAIEQYALIVKPLFDFKIKPFCDINGYGCKLNKQHYMYNYEFEYSGKDFISYITIEETTITDKVYVKFSATITAIEVHFNSKFIKCDKSCIIQTLNSQYDNFINLIKDRMQKIHEVKIPWQ